MITMPARPSDLQPETPPLGIPGVARLPYAPPIVGMPVSGCSDLRGPKCSCGDGSCMLCDDDGFLGREPLVSAPLVADLLRMARRAYPTRSRVTFTDFELYFHLRISIARDEAEREAFEALSEDEQAAILDREELLGGDA